MMNPENGMADHKPRFEPGAMHSTTDSQARPAPGFGEWVLSHVLCQTYSGTHFISASSRFDAHRPEPRRFLFTWQRVGCSGYLGSYTQAYPNPALSTTHGLILSPIISILAIARYPQGTAQTSILAAGALSQFVAERKTKSFELSIMSQDNGLWSVRRPREVRFPSYMVYNVFATTDTDNRALHRP